MEYQPSTKVSPEGDSTCGDPTGSAILPDNNKRKFSEDNALITLASTLTNYPQEQKIRREEKEHDSTILKPFISPSLELLLALQKEHNHYNDLTPPFFAPPASLSSYTSTTPSLLAKGGDSLASHSFTSSSSSSLPTTCYDPLAVRSLPLDQKEHQKWRSGAWTAEEDAQLNEAINQFIAGDQQTCAKKKQQKSSAEDHEEKEEPPPKKRINLSLIHI